MQSIPTWSPVWKSPRRGEDGPTPQLTSPFSGLWTVTDVSESRLRVPATVFTSWWSPVGGTGAAAVTITLSTPSRQPIFTLSPTWTVAMLGEPSPTEHVISPPSVCTVSDVGETALTVPAAPSDLCGPSTVPLPSFAIATSTPFRQPNLTLSPTVYSVRAGEEAPTEQVASPCSSLWNVTDEAERALIVPAPLWPFGGSPRPGSPEGTVAIATSLPLAHATLTCCPTLTLAVDG